jgi:hypothetical protein
MRRAAASSLVVVLLMLVSACWLFDGSTSLEGLWQGVGAAIYSIQVWEGDELIHEDTWEGSIELTFEIGSVASDSVSGDWYWRDLTEGAQSAEPSAPLPFTGVAADGLLALRTDDEQASPVPTEYTADFSFDATPDSLSGAGTYSEDGHSAEMRILFDLTIDEITLSKL